MPKQLTYREAAKRVGRTTRAIRYMRQDGMPMGWDVRGGQRVRVVDEQVLLKWHRQRLKNWPAHQYRLRRMLTAENEPLTASSSPPASELLPAGNARETVADGATRPVSQGSTPESSFRP